MILTSPRLDSFIDCHYVKSFQFECKLDQIVTVSGDVQLPLEVEDSEAQAVPKTM